MFRCPLLRLYTFINARENLGSLHLELIYITNTDRVPKLYFNGLLISEEDKKYIKIKECAMSS